MKYVCELCGNVYNEELGDERCGIPAGTAFADLPEQYACPSCGSEKEAFSQVKKRSLSSKGNDRDFWLNTKYSDNTDESGR